MATNNSSFFNLNYHPKQYHFYNFNHDFLIKNSQFSIGDLVEYDIKTHVNFNHLHRAINITFLSTYGKISLLKKIMV